MSVLQVRVSDQLMEDIDRTAASRGLGRSEFARGALAAALEGDAKSVTSSETVEPAANGAATLSETVELLSAKARDGVVGAQVALLRHLTAHDGTPAPDDPLAIVDRIAAERS
jgi:hypothetical protein